MNFNPTDHTILSLYRGSKAHGMMRSDSDIDIINICIAPKKYHLGLHHFEAKKSMVDCEDTDFYEIKKMFKMLLATNPNVFPYIFVDIKDCPKITSLGREILINRDLFISSKVAITFAGYARGELTRVDKPNGRMGSKRKALFDQYGYDSKSASNCIRIARMGLEFLETGKMNVDRSKTDTQELLDIRDNKFNIRDIKMEGIQLIEAVKKAIITTSLPKEPQKDKVEELQIHLIEEYWKNER